MSQTEKELQTQKVVEAAVASVLRFNEKQEYMDDDRTYPEHYIKNKHNILRAAGVDKDFNDSKIDQLLAMKEIQDTISKESPELKRLIEKGTVSLDYGDNYPAASIVTNGTDHGMVFSWEPAENINEGKIGLGGNIYVYINGENEGIVQRDLKSAIKSLESTVVDRLYSIAEHREFNGQLEKDEAYKRFIQNGDLNVKSVKITAAEFSKFPGGLDEENHVSGVIQYQIEGRDFESKFKQKISGGDYFKETVYDNIHMLNIERPEGKTILLDIETGYKDENQKLSLSGKNEHKLFTAINETLINAEPVLTANYNKPNPKLLNHVDQPDGKHYSFKPETLDALAKFGEALAKVENKKRNKLKI